MQNYGYLVTKALRRIENGFKIETQKNDSWQFGRSGSWQQIQKKGVYRKAYPLTLAELIKLNKVFQPEMVTIQVNEDFVEKEDYEKIQLKEGDRVDFLYFMGGGAC